MLEFIQMWDRKSPRHSWQLFVEDMNKERIEFLISIHLPRMSKMDGWSNGEIGISMRIGEGGGHMFTRADFTKPRNAAMERIIRVQETSK